jgi:F-type H+-transporting ATPase subunit b
MQTEAFQGVFYLRPVFYVAVAFVIFFVLFGRTLARAIAGVLDKRIAEVKRELEEAARLRREAEAMLDEAQAQRREAMAQAQQLLAYAQDEARRLAVSMAADAEAAAKRREQMALDRIAAAEKAVVHDLRVAAVDLATEAARHVLASSLTETDDAVLIDRSIAALPGAMRAA